MDGIHDLGGRQGFGPVPRNDAPYHADWERRVRGMVSVAMLQIANADAFRHAIERIDPVTYLTIGYFGRWLAALERLVEEADPRIAGGQGEARREIGSQPAFAVGDRVRARDLHTDGHTRLPGYARGRPGTIHVDLFEDYLEEAQP